MHDAQLLIQNAQNLAAMAPWSLMLAGPKNR
jgi:hypothetical protein